MKLLLLESVEGLGRPGDQVDVKAGFACNFLMPNGKAVRVNSDSLRMLTRLKEKADEEERVMLSSMEELAAKINGFAVEVQARATEEGHLFGSVTEKDVHLALTKAGWEVTQRMVRMELHLKEAGETEVDLHLFGDVRATVKVTVVPIDSDGHQIETLEDEDLEDGEDDGETDGDVESGVATESAPAAEGGAGDAEPATAKA